MSKLQNESFKTSGEAGGNSRLTNDTKVYVTANSINKTLYQAIVDSDIGGSPSADYVVIVNTTVGTYSMTSTASGTIMVHDANDTTTYQLPATPTVGARFIFINNDTLSTSVSNEMRIQPASGDSIFVGSALATNPGYVAIKTRGSVIRAIALSASQWFVESVAALQHIKNTTVGDTNRQISLVGRDTWVSKAALPAAKEQGNAFDLNGYGYQSLGFTTGLVATSTTYLYNDTQNTWTTKTNGTTALSGLGGCNAPSLNNYGYRLGGAAGGAAQNSTERYNDIADFWVTRTVLSSSLMESLSPKGLNGYIYKIAGFDGASVSSTTERYNDSANSWSNMAGYGVAMREGGVGTLNGYIYGSCGFDGGSILSSTYQYNDSANAWIQRASQNATTRRARVTSENNGFLIANTGNNGAVTNATDLYNDSTNTWTAKTASSTAKHYAMGFGIPGYSHVMGGNSITNVINALTFSGETNAALSATLSATKTLGTGVQG